MGIDVTFTNFSGYDAPGTMPNTSMNRATHEKLEVSAIVFVA